MASSNTLFALGSPAGDLTFEDKVRLIEDAAMILQELVATRLKYGSASRTLDIHSVAGFLAKATQTYRHVIQDNGGEAFLDIAGRIADLPGGQSLQAYYTCICDLRGDLSGAASLLLTTVSATKEAGDDPAQHTT